MYKNLILFVLSITVLNNNSYCTNDDLHNTISPKKLEPNFDKIYENYDKFFNIAYSDENFDNLLEDSTKASSSNKSSVQFSLKRLDPKDIIIPLSNKEKVDRRNKYSTFVSQKNKEEIKKPKILKKKLPIIKEVDEYLEENRLDKRKEYAEKIAKPLKHNKVFHDYAVNKRIKEYNKNDQKLQQQKLDIRKENDNLQNINKELNNKYTHPLKERITIIKALNNKSKQ